MLTRIESNVTPPPCRMVMRHGGEGGRPNGGPRGPCPLPSRARRTGIESRDEERKQCHAERSRVKCGFMKARASRSWIHAAAFAATNVAVCAGAKPYAQRNAGNIIQEQRQKIKLDTSISRTPKGSDLEYRGRYSPYRILSPQSAPSAAAIFHDPHNGDYKIPGLQYKHSAPAGLISCVFFLEQQRRKESHQYLSVLFYQE